MRCFIYEHSFMLKKIHRLTGKDINYIFRQQKMIPGKYFSFLLIPQYPNKNFNQFSVQVPIKLHKKVVYRNMIRRQIYDYIKNNELIQKKLNSSYYKIFIITNRKTAKTLKKTIESSAKNLIKGQVHKFIDTSFSQLLQKL